MSDLNLGRLDHLDGVGTRRMDHGTAVRVLDEARDRRTLDVPANRRSTFEAAPFPAHDPHGYADIVRNLSVTFVLIIVAGAGFWLGFLTRGAL